MLATHQHETKQTAKEPGPGPRARRRFYNGPYEGEHLNRVAFPMGGIGAGMICLEGTGALSHVSIRNRPEVFNEPCVFSAIHVKTAGGADPAPDHGADRPTGGSHPTSAAPTVTRVLEGPVPKWKLFGRPHTGGGAPGTTYGLPRFRSASFLARFPFATVSLSDPDVPLQVTITGWSPFVPGNADDSSLPVAALEFRFVNTGHRPVSAVYSFNAKNFVATNSGGATVTPHGKGFILRQPGTDEKPWEETAFCAQVDDESASVDCAWFRGGWWDPLTMIWDKVSSGDTTARPPHQAGDPSPGGSIFVPFALEPGEEKTVRLRLSWYSPHTNLRTGKSPEEEAAAANTASGACCSDDPGCCSPSQPTTYKPWYAGRFASIEEVADYWAERYDELHRESEAFRDCFYDTTLPDEVIEAVAANLTILKSPTVLRQADGRLWAWEGCHDDSGCCPGSCTHVWNYAQAICHLFPDLERSLRHTEFEISQDNDGHQTFRSLLPIRPAEHDFYAAADGQLGGIMKAYREWRISGDTEWLRRLWPKIKESLHYCIETWDPDYKGVLVEPHHNTYDIEFWGPDGMCSSFYLGALQAAILMGQAVGDDVSPYQELLKRGVAYMEERLFNGEYFIQEVIWKGLRAGSPLDAPGGRWYTPEAIELLEKEGPKYQYGNGCLADGVLGAWIAAVCGLPPFLDKEKVRSHLASVYRYNLKRDLSTHANCQRPTYAAGDEGGLLLCTWPKGGRPSLPFVYSDEVWTGIEYQVASHLMLEGMIEEGLEIVRTARDRYDGVVRNPFNEYECGHWYARAMASYALIYGLTGVRYDAVEKTLYIQPRIQGDFRSFLATETGYATVGVKDGKPFIEVKRGEIPYERIEFTPAAG